MKNSTLIKNNNSPKLRALWLGLAALLAIGFQGYNTFGATRTATKTGNWNSTATWSDGTIPTSTDDVVIGNNYTVTVDDNYIGSCKTIQLAGSSNQAGTGTLVFSSGSKLTVSGTVTLGNNNGSNQYSGTLTMTLGGQLSTSGFVLSGTATKTFTPGTGTIELTSTNTLPATVFTTFNNLIISSGKTSLAANTTVSGNLTIGTGATLDVTSSNYGITLAGNWTNNGTFTQRSGTVTFSGTDNSTISGSSATTFSNLTINKTNSTSIVDLTGSGSITVNGTFELTKGVFRISTGGTLNHSGALPIPDVASIHVNGGTFTKTSGGITNSGAFTVSGGTVVIGSTSVASIVNSNGNIFTLSGGTLTINGRLENTTGTVNITGGTLILSTFGNSTATASFDMSATTNLNISGSPLIIFQKANSGSGGDLKITSGSGTKSITGGTFQFGNGQTPASATFKLATGAALYNVTVSGTNSPNLSVESHLEIAGTLTVNSGGTLSPLSTVVISGTTGSTLTGTGTLLANRTDNTADLDSQYAIANRILSGLSVNYSGNGDQFINAHTYNNLILSGSGTKTISAGTSVTVNANLTTNDKLAINSDGTNSGSLIVNGTSTGTATYNRWYKNTAFAGDIYNRWYITSAPVNVTSGFDANASKINRDLTTTPNEYDFATYTEAENAGWHYLSTIPASLTAGQGYLISVNTSSLPISYSGTLNESPTLAVTSSANNGWNAVGNPYTSAIKIVGGAGSGSFLYQNAGVLTPEFAAIYVWNEDAAFDGTQQYYKVIGNSGYNPPNDAFGTLSETNIQVGQGFLINSQNIGPVQFNRAMQVSDPGLSLKSAETSWPGVTLNVESKGKTRSTVVAFNEKMTTGLDISYDAGLLAEDFQVYTHLVGGGSKVDFAIQSLPENKYLELSIPVGVDLPEAGAITFKAAGIILPDGLYPVLEDKLSGVKTAFKSETDSYATTLAGTTSGMDRFYLSFEGNYTATKTNHQAAPVSANISGSRIVILGPVEADAKAMLFDLAGRKLGEHRLMNSNRNEFSVSGLENQLYLLRVEGKNLNQVIKLVATGF